MQNMSRISKAALFSVLSLTLGASSAFAALDVTGDNFITGPYSYNKNKVELERNVNVDLVNKNYEKNYLDYWFNTGKNEVEKNTTTNNVATGDVEAAFSIANHSNVAGAAQGSGSTGQQSQNNAVLTAFDPILVNQITGPCSENINKVKVTKNLNLDIVNKAEVKNDIDLFANTGKNEVKKNTVVGNVSTGDVQVNGAIDTVANANQCFTCPDILGLVAGNDSEALNLMAGLSNDTTGPDSVNINKVKIDENVNVNVLNKAYIKNDLEVKANTGKNEVAKNTVVGDVSTGSIMVDFSISNQAN